MLLFLFHCSRIMNNPIIPFMLFVLTAHKILRAFHRPPCDMLKDWLPSKMINHKPTPICIPQLSSILQYSYYNTIAMVAVSAYTDTLDAPMPLPCCQSCLLFALLYGYGWSRPICEYWMRGWLTPGKWTENRVPWPSAYPYRRGRAGRGIGMASWSSKLLCSSYIWETLKNFRVNSYNTMIYIN